MGGYGNLLGNLFNQGQQFTNQMQQQQQNQQRPIGMGGGYGGGRFGAGAHSINFVPQSGITLPYTLSSGPATGLLQQYATGQTNPLGFGQG